MSIDMFIDPDKDPRAEPPMEADERSLLAAFLGWYRHTLELKCSGLYASDLARRAVEPSSMSLLGLIRHMAEVERSWFRVVMAGEQAAPHFSGDTADPDFDGAVADPAVVTEAWEVWRAEVANSERFVAEAKNLDIIGEKRTDRGPVSLRWVLIHMVEEYARHVGHADLLRERIDGRVGQ